MTAYAVAYGLTDHLAFVGLAVLLMLLVDRFAILSVGLSAFLLNDSAAGTRMLRSATLAPPDPIARDFARVRRERSRLTVASIALGGRRASARRLAEVARALVPCLRVTDAIVRAAADGIVVVLPGADEPVTRNVLGRMSTAKRRDLVLGTATFPDDGQTYALLKDVARSRRRPWLDADTDGPSSNGHVDREPRAERALQAGAPPQPPADRPAVLFEARTLSIPLRRGVDLLVLLLIAPIVIPLVALLALAVKITRPMRMVFAIRPLHYSAVVIGPASRLRAITIYIRLKL